MGLNNTLGMRALTSFIFIMLILAELTPQVVKDRSYSLNKIKKDTITLSKDAIIRAMALKKKQDRLSISVSRMDSLVSKWRKENKKEPVVSGYRIQVAVGIKDSIYNRKEEFLNKYPDINTYMYFSPPSFKLRVGDFFGPWSFWEAKILANKLKEDFNSVFCVKEEINLEDLK